MECALSAPKGRPNTAQANGLGNGSRRWDSRALKGRNKSTHPTEAAFRGSPSMLFRPFRACRQERANAQTQAVGLGCVRSPLLILTNGTPDK